MSDEQVPAYIARCSRCHGIIMAVVDDGSNRKAVARDVAEAIAKGWAVERVTVGWVREHANEWCRCSDSEGDDGDNAGPQQPMLAFA